MRHRTPHFTRIFAGEGYSADDDETIDAMAAPYLPLVIPPKRVAHFIINYRLVCYLKESIYFPRDRTAMTDLLNNAESLRLLQNAPALIWRSDTEAKCYWFNRTWLEFAGRTIEQEAGDGWTEGVHPDDFDDCLKTFLTSFGERRAFSMEYRFRRHDGVYRWILDNGIPSENAEGVFDGYIGYCFDITERKTMEQAIIERSDEMEQINSELRLAREALERLALTDNLTGLSNRHDILGRFDLERQISERLGTPMSLLVIDIDFFKKVNDTYGHMAGDQCLKTLADELRSFAKKNWIVGRLGGEEFVLILPGIDSAAALAAAVKLCRHIAKARFSVMGQPVPITVSVGGATNQAGTSSSFDNLLERADKALYEAKAAGRNTARISASLMVSDDARAA